MYRIIFECETFAQKSYDVKAKDPYNAGLVAYLEFLAASKGYWWCVKSFKRATVYQIDPKKQEPTQIGAFEITNDNLTFIPDTGD